MKFTSQQQTAIDARGRSLIVSAAAGSGKTAVLVERLMKIICDSENRIPVSDMAVMTFTKAAAAEMKQRLLTRLTDLMTENTSDKWIASQCSQIGSASICTIHSFCFELIRDNIAYLPLASDFRIIEAAEEKVFKDNVMKRLIDILYAEYSEKMEMLCDNFCGNNDKRLIELIAELYKDISSIPFFEIWLKKLPDIYESGEFEKEACERVIKMLKGYLSSAEKCLKKAETVRDIKLCEAISGDTETLKKALELWENGEYTKAAEVTLNASLARFPQNKKDVPDPELRASVKKTRESYYESGRIKNANICKNIPYAEDDIQRHKQIMSFMSEIILKYDKMLLEYKFKRNAISFDDGERLALDLIARVSEDGKIEKTPLGEQIADDTAFIMVDEFQDSNNRQDMIFRLISKNGSAESYGSDLFFVGDVKQAIYRFRQANPENFINAQKKAEPYSGDGSSLASITLNKNFRSSPQVIDLVNFVFENIMSEECGDICYDKEQELVNGMDFCEGERDTSISLIDMKKDGDDAEALAIAYRIRKMLDEKTPVSINGGNASRPCTMRDFCILTRSRSNNRVYEEALKKYGLDVNCPDVSGYLDSREISVLIDLMRVIDNPLLDIPLSAVMMSPMFMFSADDMIRLRLINKKAKLYSNLCAVSDKEMYQNGEYNELYKKVVYFREFIGKLRLMTVFSSLPELIRYVYDNTEFVNVIQLNKNSERKKANLRLLLEYANKFESVSGSGVNGFVKYIDRVLDTGGDLESSDMGNSGRNAVSLMTMHKSKGLEFPFVFIADAGRKFNKEDSKKTYQFSDKYGIGFKLQNKDEYEKFTTLPYDFILQYNNAKRMGEEIRLLYVAMTRAKERLFLSLDISEKRLEKYAELAECIYRSGGITPGLTASAMRMEDWIAEAVLYHPSGAELRERCGVYESICGNTDSKLCFEEPDIEKIRSGYTDTVSERYTEPDRIKTDKLIKMLDFEYDRTYVEKTTKFSVSDIAKNDEMFLMPGRPAFAREDGLSAAEKGTAVHCFLQFAEFKKLENGFEQERDRMIRYGHITPKQGSIIKKEDIEPFLRSEVYKAAVNAKKLYREKSFLVALDDIRPGEEFGLDYKGTNGMLSGKMDMVIENEDSLILVDYKTDKADNGEVLKEKYEKQLLLYKMSLEHIQKKSVAAGYIYSFSLGKDIRVF